MKHRMMSEKTYKTEKNAEAGVKLVSIIQRANGRFCYRFEVKSFND